MLQTCQLLAIAVVCYVHIVTYSSFSLHILRRSRCIAGWRRMMRAGNSCHGAVVQQGAAADDPWLTTMRYLTAPHWWA